MSKRTYNKDDALDLVEALGFDPREVHRVELSAGDPVTVEFSERSGREPDESVEWETAKPHALKFVKESLNLDPDVVRFVSISATGAWATTTEFRAV